MAVRIRRRRFGLHGGRAKKRAPSIGAARHGGENYRFLAGSAALPAAAGTAEVSDEIVDALAGPSYRAWLRGDRDGLDSFEDLEAYQAARSQRELDYEDPEELWSDDGAEDMCAAEEEQEAGGFGMGEDISTEEYKGFLSLLPKATPHVDVLPRLDLEQEIELHERLALYRIKACKLLQGEAIVDLDTDKLRRVYPPECIKKNGYFECYEEDGTLGWFFHPDHCELAALDDYQRRLVLKNEGGYEYMDWNGYCLSYHTYEIDREYVKYCETISKEIKWFKLTNRGAFQAMKIATRFTKISVGLAHLAFMEYISNLSEDFYNSKELDGVFFEVWKRVTKQQKSFRDALKEVHELNKFQLRQRLMEYVLQHDCSDMETQFRSCAFGIHGEVQEVKAHRLIARRVRALGYEQYARKKLKIAELLGLIPKA